MIQKYIYLNWNQNLVLKGFKTEMETGKELENIKFPEEDYNLSIETWDNPVDTEGSTEDEDMGRKAEIQLPEGFEEATVGEKRKNIWNGKKSSRIRCT